MTRLLSALLTLAIVIGALASTGCRQRGRVYDEIRRRDERFAMEDRAFELENKVEALQQQLASCRGALSARSRRVQSRPDNGSDELVPPTVDGLGEELTTPPVVDEGTEFDPNKSPAPLPEPQGNGEAASEIGPLFEGAARDGVLSKLAINRLLTGGYDADDRAGHEGVLVVFEPRDAADRLVDVDGQVDVVVVNPSLGFGPEADVARWHFGAAEAATFKKNTPLGRGYQFELPWPTQLATGGTFRVYVRLITPDQQIFTAQHKIEVVAPGPAQDATWSRTPERPRRWTAGERSQRMAAARRPDWTEAKNQPPIRIVERPTPARKRPAADDSDHEVRAPPARKAARPRWTPYR
jgi:hypothetical protein